MVTSSSGSNRLPDDWPVPDEAAIQLSERLRQKVCDEVIAAGPLSFARYMELVLYEPGLGYYSAGSVKFGAAGDFVTAPEVSPLFSRCVARSCGSVLAGLGGGDILELGAGSGAMAVDMLSELQQIDQLPGKYFILERSADLARRQQTLVQQEIPGLAHCVEWLSQPPADPFSGVVVANEVLDALPVHRFRWHEGGVREIGVSVDKDGCFQEVEQAGSGRFVDRAELLNREVHFHESYCSEVNLDLQPWMDAVVGSLSEGMALFIDYGYSRKEYYHPQHNGGTLLCHYRHRAHDDPFLLPGLQDVTAHVDFSSVADAAHELGFDLAGFATQAHFLMDAGLTDFLAAMTPGADAEYLKTMQQVKTLTLPGEMGERFKCMALSRGLSDTPLGFRQQDLRRIL